VGRDKRIPYMGDEDDVFLVNCTENMNRGKTYRFFQTMVQKFPWATHVGKMDTDTFPYLHRLTASLSVHANGNECKNQYVGSPMDFETCGSWEWCPPAECGPPVGGDLLKFNAQSNAGQNCWSYMQGGMYVISAPLLREVTGPNTLWSMWQAGFEDMKVGRILMIHGRKTGQCIATWNPNAWDHLGEVHLKSEAHPIVMVSDWLAVPSALDQPPDFVKMPKKLFGRRSRSGARGAQ